MLRDIVLKFDLFGQILDEEHRDGLKIYRSLFGTALSIFFFTILILYTVFKYQSMNKYNDTNIMISYQENFYTDRDILQGGK